MNKFQLLLVTSLLLLSGFTAYLISSARKISNLSPVSGVHHTSEPRKSGANNQRQSNKSHPLLFSDINNRPQDPTNYEVTVSELSLQEVGLEIEQDSQARLREMTERYQLTANQRREIFPLLVSYHAHFQDGLIVNGFAAEPPNEDGLASAIYPILDLNQKEIYQEDLLANQEWWGEFIEQLREDLDGALTNGEVDLIIESGRRIHHDAGN